MVCVALVVIAGCGSGSDAANTSTTSGAAGATTSTVPATAPTAAPELRARLAAFVQCVRKQRASGSTAESGTPANASSACLASVCPDPSDKASTGSTASPGSAGAVPSTVAGPKSPDLPRFDGDFADPSVLISGTTAYAYATNTPQANVPVLRATIGGSNSVIGDALPTLPSWSQPGWVWAPSVLQLSPTSFDLFYTTRDRVSQKQCISVATSNSPRGPFVDHSSGALVCQLPLGGSIDPSTISDGASTTLVWKSDGNCCNLPTTIWSAPLSADGLSLTGTPTALIHDDQPWEAGVVEGPSMVRNGSTYDLLYSGGKWDTPGYGMGFATCTGPAGPCQKPTSAPFLSSSDGRLGPGGGQVFTLLGRPVMVYAAWTNGKVGYASGGVRSLFVSRLDLSGSEPRVS